MCQKCTKKAILSHFCQFLLMNYFGNVSFSLIKCDKKLCKIKFLLVFVTFLLQVLSEFKYILNFDTFLLHFQAIFVGFLTHFGFWHIFVRFTEIFDSYLSQFCVLTHFWQIFVNFCYIFDTFLKWWDLHWQPVPLLS